jgi:hypothetical protein
VADLNRQQLRQLAVKGAMTRLQELQNEEAAIRQAFPELGRKSPAALAPAPTRRRSRMSRAARKAVSERMKRYWAERRKAKAAKK